MPNLSPTQLRERLLESFVEAGVTVSLRQEKKPYMVAVSAPDGRGATVVAYVWNCTHGGGGARPAHEYRVQFTGAMPRDHAPNKTLILGWHDGYQVWAAWDIRAHDSSTGSSPSAQIQEAALRDAAVNGFARVVKTSGEWAVAFRPELIFEYVDSLPDIHNPEGRRTLDRLNNIDSISEQEIDRITNLARRSIVRNIVKKYRAVDFRRRVLSAYDHKCAICGLDLNIVEAAHIVPVTDASSTDETSNGIALCPNHHRAFDSLLISVDEQYAVELSKSKAADLRAKKRDSYLSSFKQGLKPIIVLPADRRDWPSKTYLRASRTVKGWQP